MIEHHPYKPFIPDAADTLIIGTIPPLRFAAKELFDTDVDFYYGSRHNLFWPVIDTIFTLGLLRANNAGEIEKRKSFLCAHNLGMADIVLRCKRKKQSAQDRNLLVIECLDLAQLLDVYPCITRILFTSHSSPNSAQKLAIKTLEKSCALKDKVFGNSPTAQSHFTFTGKITRCIHCYNLLSPSPSAGRQGVTFENRIEQYQSLLLKNQKRDYTKHF